MYGESQNAGVLSRNILLELRDDELGQAVRRQRWENGVSSGGGQADDSRRRIRGGEEFEEVLGDEKSPADVDRLEGVFSVLK